MSNPVSSIADATGLLLSVIGKVMDKMPDYPQKKKEEYHILRTAYEEEKSKNYPHRDDNLVGLYRDRVLRFASDFNSEISG